MYLENAAINEADTLSLGSECNGSTGELARGRMATYALLIFINCVSKCVSESRKIMLVCFPLFPIPSLHFPCPAFFVEKM